MSTDVCSSLGSLTAELENAKRSLHKIDDDIKKIVQTTGRFQIDRNFQNTSDSPRGGQRPFNTNFFQENRNSEDDRHARKRPQETKTVFSRLSARPAGDSDGEDEFPSTKKPRVSSQVIRELPSKQQILKAQAGDEVSKARNRRMFGSLLGTLQKFKQEEIVLKNKEDKKARVEKKIEDQAKQERENERKERQNLFAEREFKKATIKALEEKMIRMQYFEKWESVHKPLLNFIETKWKPHIYWLPKIMNSQAKEKYDFSRKKQEQILEKKQLELKEELEAIEERSIRGLKNQPGPRAKSNSISQSAEADDHADRGSKPADENLQNDDNRPNIPFTKIKQEREKDESKQKEEKHNTKKLLSPEAIKQEKNKIGDTKNGEASTKEKKLSHSSDGANDGHTDDKSRNDSNFHDEEITKNHSNPPKEGGVDERNSQHDAAVVNGDNEDVDTAESNPKVSNTDESNKVNIGQKPRDTDSDEEN